MKPRAQTRPLTAEERWKALGRFVRREQFEFQSLAIQIVHGERACNQYAGTARGYREVREEMRRLARARRPQRPGE